MKCKKYKWTIKLFLLSIPLLVIALFSMGGGHGSYITAIGLFPFGLISIILIEKITMPFVIIGIIQFPIYGYIIDKARQVNKTKMVLSIIVLTHIVLAISISKLMI